MKTQTILSAAVLVLAACGNPGGNESGGSGGGLLGGGVTLQPGEWEMKTEVVNVAAEGLPAGMADGMKKSAGSTTRTCMTPEEAKGPKGDLFAGDKNGNCKSESFNWAGGKISGKTTCTGQGGMGKTVMTMDGSYGAQNIDMTMKSETDLGGKAMTMEMRISGRRVGECSAGTKEG
ncbi:MAG TPA: DUF3617 domain-containing protein [Allosphingosinicella sp.]|nr:DUF3617 domain-containing protein [Allosphingosinicella sp.]